MPDTEDVRVKFTAGTADLETGTQLARQAIRGVGEESERTGTKFQLFSSRGMNLLTTMLALRGAVAITSDVLKSFGLASAEAEKFTGALTLALNVGVAVLALYRTALLVKAAAEFIAAKASILHGIGIAGTLVPIAGFAIGAAVAAAAWIAITQLSLPRAQFGGIVPPRPGGTPVIIGEAGEPEAIIPLSRAGRFGIGDVHINIERLETPDARQFVRALGREIQQLKSAGA